MIKTFDDYMKDNKNTNGIQTFDNYVKANNLKISSTIASPNVTTKKKTNWLSKALDVVNFASNPTKGMTNLMTKQAQKGVSDSAKVLNDIRIGNTSVISKPNSNATSLEKAVTTGLNANKLFVENMMKSVEGTIDTGASLLSGTGKVLGANTSKIDNFIKKNLTQNSLDYIFGKGNKEKGRKLQEQADENSYITNKDLAGQVVSAVGGQVPTILASGIAQGSGLSEKNVERVNKLTFGSKVYGNSMEEALNNGASFKDATKYAVGSTAVEIASEWLTGGIPGTNGKGALDNLAGKLIGEPIEKASSSLSKAILKYGYRMVGEASEEMLSEFLQPFVEQLTYKYENSKSLTGNLKEGLNNVSVEDILIAGITGALSAGILDAPVSFSDISQAKRNKANTNINSNLENSTTTEEKIKSNTNTGSVSNIAHTSSNVVQKLNNQEENITERLEKIKRLQEVAKQNKKYDKINEVLEEYKNIQEKQNETMQNIENNQNNLIEQINSETQQPKYDLTIDEQNELDALKKTDLAIGLDEKENARLNYLEKKQNGLIKYPDLIGKNSYENIKPNYWNYKNSLDSYNPTLYNKIKEVTPSYRNTGRMTKTEWLGLAKNIGANFKGDSQSLEKYAVQTWFYASPQNNLNRQGKKFVKFDIGEWLTSFYEGAGVGTEINIPTKANTSSAQTNYSMSNLPLSSYNYVESNNTKINELRKSASQYLNSSEKTIRTIDLMEKIIADKDYRLRFNPNITNESGVPVNGLITKENGQVTIELNPNANNYVEFLIVHEITHDIATKEMKELILDYAKQDSKFEKSLETLKERYKTDDVSDEVVADVCGELFGSREFIQSVVEKKPNIFKKILNNIRNLAKKIKGTGTNEYVNFVENLKEMWEEAYYSNKSSLKDKRFSIQQDSNGNKFVNVDTDQDIFDGKTLSEQTKIARQYILDNFRQNGINVNNENIDVTSKTANEYTHPRNPLPVTTKSSKMKASTELDNLLSISKYKYSKSDDGRHRFAKNGWDYYETTFKVGDNLFTGLVNIGKSDNKKTLYDITNIKRIDQNRSTSANAFTTSLVNSVANNIPQSDNNVNSGTSSTTKYSMSISENNAQELDNSSFSFDNKGRKLSKGQQEYFKDSKARDENGNLKVLYHGTPNDFTKFSYDKLGTNGTLLGKGFYLTDDINVAKAYASKGEKGKVMELYADIKKPLKWGEKSISKQQYKSFVESINEITNGTLFADYSGEYSEKGSTQYNSTLNDILMDYEYGGDDIDLVSGILNTTGMSWNKGYKILKDTTGYDGIIVTTDVYDSGEGNVYIPFQSNQIKNVDNTNPTSNEDIRYSQNTKEWNDYLKENFPSSGTKTKMSDIKLPVREDIESTSKKSKILNPNEISKLTKEDANTAPNLPNYKKSKYSDGKSKFAKNIKDKANMLNEEQKSIALSEDDVKFYDKVTNKESLEKAFKKLEKNGASETLEWFNKDPKNANSIDVAEGWILLKQYADNNDALGMKNVAKKTS